MTPNPWSPSGLAELENCARAFNEQRVLRNVQGTRTEHSDWGDRVHLAFETFFDTDGKELPGDLGIHRKYLETLHAKDGIFWTEQKVAFDKKAQPCSWEAPKADIWGRFKIDYVKVNMHADVPIADIRDWKGLPLDTLISTASGFVPMGEIRVGDMVHASDGHAYPVLVKSPIKTKSCFRVTFDDKTSVVCDDEHLWLTTDGDVVSVKDLLPGVDKIPVANPVEMAPRDLPIDPYVLGLWLADGKHTSSEISKPDQEIWNEIVRRGYELGSDTGTDTCPTRTVKGIRGSLVSMDLFRNKHVPPDYLLGSIAQRVDLLRGLMDGDGHANPSRQQVGLTTINKQLSDDVKVLIESLGCRVNQAKVKYAGFNVTGIAYPLYWRPRHFNPFLLSRKANQVLDVWGANGRTWYRRIESVIESLDQPTQCIAVGSPDNTYLCTSSRIVTHNTGKQKDDFTQLIIYALHTFALHPGLRLCDVRFYWTQTQTETRKIYGVDEVPKLWEFLIPKLVRWRDAFRNEEWFPRKSGLCRGWCPVTTCEFWEEKRK